MFKNIFLSPSVSNNLTKSAFNAKKSLKGIIIFRIAFVYAVVCVNTMLASAQTATDSIQRAASQTPSTTPPAAMTGPSPMPFPGMTGPLTANPNPVIYDAGLLGNIYLTGVASGIGQWQNSIFPGDREFQSDLSNGQIFLQKNSGVVQFFVQAGAYSLPDIGVPYVRTVAATGAFYGVLPQGFLKIAPSNNFSIMAGKLPTLIGAEYTFSFENMNIQRGLLWNQENAVNRGVQANYTAGPLTFAVSWNDGFYSNRYTWAWVSATYAVNKA